MKLAEVESAEVESEFYEINTHGRLLAGGCNGGCTKSAGSGCDKKKDSSCGCNCNSAKKYSCTCDSSTGCSSSCNTGCSSCSAGQQPTSSTCKSNGVPTSCGACQAGVTYSSSGTACLACSNTNCASGQYQDGQCTTTSNGFGCKTCTNINCPSQYYRSGVCSGRTNAYLCNYCAQGKFKTGTNALTGCLDCGHCGAGLYRSGCGALKLHDDTSDNRLEGVCTACPPAYFKEEYAPGTTPCELCAGCGAGKFRCALGQTKPSLRGPLTHRTLGRIPSSC